MQQPDIDELPQRIKRCAADYRGSASYQKAADALGIAQSTYHRMETTGAASAELLARLVWHSGADPRKLLLRKDVPCNG